MEPTYNASRDQRLLAAYIFGYRSRTLWFWHELFWQMYFVGVNTTADPLDRLQDGPRLVVEELEWCMSVNAKYIYSNIFIMLPSVMNKFAESPENAIERFDHLDEEEQAKFL